MAQEDFQRNIESMYESLETMSIDVRFKALIQNLIYELDRAVADIDEAYDFIEAGLKPQLDQEDLQKYYDLEPKLRNLMDRWNIIHGID